MDLKLFITPVDFTPCPHFCFVVPDERPATAQRTGIFFERAVRQAGHELVHRESERMSRGNRWVLPCVPRAVVRPEEPSYRSQLE